MNNNHTKIAIDEKGIRIEIENARKGAKYFC